MNRTSAILHAAILFLGFAVAVGWLVLRGFKRSQDPALMLFKILFTIPLVFLLVVAVPWFSVPGVFVIVLCAIFLSLMWTPHLGALLAKPLTDIFDDGSREPDPRPLYSIAQAKRNRGHYTEAVAEIRKQLDRFPSDVEGQLMIAEIQAQNLNDLPGAEVTIHRLVNQPGHTPRNIAVALNMLADWHLKYSQDREAARQALEEIVQRLPGSELAVLAAQRIGHLADTAFLLDAHDRHRIAVTPGVANIGLLAAELHPKAPEADPAQQTAELVRHLESHPLDTDAREKLAVLYADHYRRLDLATDQLEQLIGYPNQPARKVVHWLNLLADLQIRHSGNYESVRQTLQRIVDLFPDSAAAHTALSRLDHVKLEIKGKQQGQTLALGTYEQDIGLKGKLPHQL
jgi:tetratricopeptide (TPR) repeat protein